MKLQPWASMTVSEAKLAFQNGIIKEIRIDVVMGEYTMIVKTNIDEMPIRTARYTMKKYKSLDAILKDYQYITCSEVKTLILK